MGRRYTNEVHNYFSFDEHRNLSKCHICNNGVKGKHGTNLLRHLSTRHPNIFSQVKFINKTRKIQDSGHDETYNAIARVRNTFSVKKIEERESYKTKTILNECVNIVTIHGRPLQLFDDAAFQNIINLIPPDDANRAPINSYEICKNIKQQSKEMCEKISEELCNKYICLKVDILSHLNKKIVGIHAQYINEDIVILRTLSIRQFNEIVTPISLQRKILETLQCYNISIRQIYSITTDDFTNVTELAAPEIMTEQEDPSADSDKELDFKLIDKEDESETTKKDVKILLVPREEHMLPRHRIKQEIDVASASTVNCVPNQTYSYVVTAVKCTASILNKAIKKAQNSFNENKMKPKEEQVSEINAGSLYPTRKFQNRLLTEEMTCGDFFGAWMTCILETEKIDTVLALEITKSLKVEQKRLFQDAAFVAAIYLDPRFNIVLSPEDVERARIHLNSTWAHMLKIDPLSVDDDEESISEEDEVEIMLRRIEQQKKTTRNSNGFNSEQMNAAIFGFTNQHRIKSRENVLEFWQSQKVSNPYLYKLATTVLAVPTTHVSAKIMLSAMKFIAESPELEEELLNSILLIRYNQNNFTARV